MEDYPLKIIDGEAIDLSVAAEKGFDIEKN